MSGAEIRRHGRTLVATGLLLLVALPALADFKQDYLKGVEALEKGSWAEAATLFRSALAEESQESPRIKFYGVVFKPYLVHYHLGEALVQLGECQEAITRFDESERQGAIQQVGDMYDRLKASRDRCRTTVRPPTATPTAAAPLRPTATPAPSVDPRQLREAQQRAQSALAEASRYEEALKNLQRRAEYREVYTQRPDLAQRLEKVSSTLQQARTLLDQGGRQERIADLESAATLATGARRELEDIQHATEVARSLLADGSEQEREARRQQLLREISSLVAPAQRTLDEGQRLPQTGKEQIVREHRTLELVVSQARNSDSLSVMQLESLKEQLQIATGDLRNAMQRAAQAPAVTPTPRGPDSTVPPPDQPEAPPALRNAIGAYLRADYRAAVDTLRRADFPQPRTAAVGYLFRASAQYFLYLEGGSRSEELKESAAEDVRATRAKDPSVAPLPEYFSPSFIQFFDSVR